MYHYSAIKQHVQQRSPSTTSGLKKSSSSTLNHPHLHNDTLSFKESPPSVSTPEHGKGSGDGKMAMKEGIEHQYVYSNHNSTGTTPPSLPLDVLFNCATISADCKHFIAFLLHFDPKQRAGYCGIQGIKNHPFFKSFDWDAIEEHKLVHPYDLGKYAFTAVTTSPFLSITRVLTPCSFSYLSSSSSSSSSLIFYTVDAFVFSTSRSSDSSQQKQFVPERR